MIVLEQQPDAPAGLLGEWADARGAAARTLRAPELHRWPDPRAADAVVALGSERSVHASPDAWIAREVAFLREAHDAGVPVLGICFGAQALAAALGGDVARAARREIGWVAIDGAAPFGGRWFTWHEDAFTAPPRADVLAANALGTQAFALGRSVGVQFHPEVDAAIVDDWLRAGRDAVPDPAPLRRETAARIDDARRRALALFDAFARG